jgi:hypothetical protein
MVADYTASVVALGWRRGFGEIMATAKIRGLRTSKRERLNARQSRAQGEQQAPHENTRAKRHAT